MWKVWHQLYKSDGSVVAREKALSLQKLPLFSDNEIFQALTFWISLLNNDLWIVHAESIIITTTNNNNNAICLKFAIPDWKFADYRFHGTPGLERKEEQRRAFKLVGLGKIRKSQRWTHCDDQQDVLQ